MDELEREFRAALDHLADGPEPSDDLVGRTVDRSIRIRRHRRVITGSSVAVAIVATLAVVSIAGAATRHGQVGVSGPSAPGESTAIGATTTIPIVVFPTTTNPHPTRTSLPVVTPTTAAVTCPVAVVQDSPADASYTLLDNGNIEVTYAFPFGPARESHYYINDDGTSGDSGFTNVYTPDQFGPHWYEEWSQAGGTPEDLSSCKTRHNFVVDPSVATPAASTTTVPAGVTIPVETTIPVTTTTAGP
jgi:hypothetical protein